MVDLDKTFDEFREMLDRWRASSGNCEIPSEEITRIIENFSTTSVGNQLNFSNRSTPTDSNP